MKKEFFQGKTIIMHMNIGDKMPELLGKDQNGNEIKAADLQGKKVVLYFYPKDMTSGCTAEACNLRDNYQKFREAGYVVVGVSVDEASKHLKFIEKNDLPFDLISDTEKKLVNDFGVWTEKKMYGKTYMGTVRSTFIFDENGILTHIMSGKEIKTSDHANQIFKLVGIK